MGTRWGQALLTKTNSLFAKILLSFLAIILLFSTFHLLAFAFFKSNIQQEIIQYNRLILNSTADRYSSHFIRVKTMLFNHYNDVNVTSFNRELLNKQADQVNYLIAKQTISNLRTDIYNPLFYLDNMILYFRSADVALDKEGSSDAAHQFGRAYAKSGYPLSFWQEQFGRGQNYMMLPSALIGGKELLPVTLIMPGSHYLLIALIDMNKVQHSFFGENEGRTFLIVGEKGEVLFQSGGEGRWSGVLPEFAPGRDFVLTEENYFFAQKGEEGLTYITVVPYANIASKLQRLNVTLIFIFLLSVAIGVAASFFFSKRINNPVKQLISSIMNRSPSRLKTTINEFAFIHQKIDELHKEKEAVQKDLQQKKSILTSYSYINKLKSINTEISEWNDFIHADECFTVVLYDLRFRSASFAEIEMSSDRAAYYFREHIGLMTGDRFPSSHTFQIERDQILSVIGGNVPREQIHALLREMKAIFDRDKRYCLITAAVSSMFEHSSQFSLAYRQVTEMAQQALLLEETQLLFDSRPAPESFALSPTQYQEMNAGLQAGNDAVCIQLAERWMEEMARKEAGIGHFRQFADSLCSKTLKMLELFKVETGDVWPVKPVVRQLKECCTLEEYKASFRQLFALAGAAIREKKQEYDPIIAYVMDVLLTKYAEDISLEYLANQRNMSSAYLSVYIKEKTGVNFSDHLNNIRIEKAKELLAHSEASIQDVSQRIGYRNITSFNRMFKKSVGMTPGEYRKQAMDPSVVI